MQGVQNTKTSQKAQQNKYGAKYTNTSMQYNTKTKNAATIKQQQQKSEHNTTKLQHKLHNYKMQILRNKNNNNMAECKTNKQHKYKQTQPHNKNNN